MIVVCRLLFRSRCCSSPVRVVFVAIPTSTPSAVEQSFFYSTVLLNCCYSTLLLYTCYIRTVAPLERLWYRTRPPTTKKKKRGSAGGRTDPPHPGLLNKKQLLCHPTKYRSLFPINQLLVLKRLCERNLLPGHPSEKFLGWKYTEISQ